MGQEACLEKKVELLVKVAEWGGDGIRVRPFFFIPRLFFFLITDPPSFFALCSLLASSYHDRSDGTR